MPIPTGTRLSYYEIKSHLGSGGMGEVYLALDTRLGRKVALKLLPAKPDHSIERTKRFEREAHAASSLNHPNILTIHEIGEADGHRFITSEYVEGESLRQRLRRRQMGLLTVVDIASQIASALSAAHEAGIVHRDIKPENIMVRKDGLVKILDFGLAKLVENDWTNDSEEIDRDAPTQTLTITVPGRVLGTVAYMSPEQTRGPNVDARSDIWSLGVVLYEMITGTAPFHGDSRSDVIAAILKSDPTPLSHFSPDVPPELERILMRMLAKDRSARYQSSHDVLFSLKELKQELEIRARIGSPHAVTVSADHRVNGAARGLMAAGPTGTGLGTNTAKQSSVITVKSLVSHIGQHKKGWLWTFFIILIGISAVAYFTRSTPATPIDSLAVLPFSIEGVDENLEALADGFSESLIDRLSQSSQLSLTARASSFKYKGKQIDPQQVARALGVQALVQGRAVQHGNELLFRVELVDTRTMRQIWGNSYSPKVADLEQVAADVAREIESRLHKSPSLEQTGANVGLTDEEAYMLYRKGRYSSNKLTREGQDQSIEFYNRVIQKDPRFALAYSGLATSYIILGANYLPPSENFAKARTYALKALELDDTLAEAHLALATAMVTEWNLFGAEKETSHALELNPNLAGGYSLRGVLSLAHGQPNEAIRSFTRALELDPFSFIFNMHLATAYYHARQYDRSIEQLNKTLIVEPADPFFYEDLCSVYAQMGKFEDAVAACKKGLESQPESEGLISTLGITYARWNKDADAERQIGALKQLGKKKFVQSYLVALIYANLGKNDQAFPMLEKAIQEHSWQMFRFVRIDPALDRIRSDPRFEPLVRRVYNQ